MKIQKLINLFVLAFVFIGCQDKKIQQKLDSDEFAEPIRLEEVTGYTYPMGVFKESGDGMRGTLLFWTKEDVKIMNVSGDLQYSAIPIVLDSEGFYVYPKEKEVISIFNEFNTSTKDVGIKTWFKGFWDKDKENFFFVEYKLIK